MHSSTLIVVIMTFCLSVAVVWMVVGNLLKISMRASMHWAASNGLIGMGLSFWVLNTSTQGTVQGFFADTVLLASFCMIRRGVQIFTHHTTTDAEQMLVFTVGTALFFSHHNGLDTPYTVSAFAVLSSWTFGRCGLEAHKYMVKEFAIKVAMLPLLPVFFLSAAFGWWAYMDFMRLTPTQFDFISGNMYTGPFLIGVMVCAFTFNVSLSFIVVSRLVLKLKHLSTRDHLTNLINRRQIQTDLQRLTLLLEKRGDRFSFLMIDLDKFKSINDTYGHDVGDIVLKKTALIFERIVKKDGLVGRLGGEEFCIILPESNDLHAQRVGERIRSAMEVEPMPAPNKTFYVTISVGIATCVTAEEGWSNLMKRADIALYKAKSNGRNRIEFSNPSWSKKGQVLPRPTTKNR